MEDNTIQLYKEYASGSYSKEEYLLLRKSNQSLLGEPEESEDDLKQCSMLEEYDGSILSKLIDRVYL